MNFTRIFILASGVAIILLIMLSCYILVSNSGQNSLPPLPKLSTSSMAPDQAVKAVEIANYKELLNVGQKQKSDLFDFVTKTLISIFNSIIVAVLAYVLPKTALELYRIHKTGEIQEADD